MMNSESLSRNIYLLLLFPISVLLLSAWEVRAVQDVGYLSITSQPKSALIYLDNEYTNTMTSTWKLLEVTPGRHRIGLAKSGYKLYEEWVTIERARALEIQVELAEADSGENTKATKRYVESYLSVRSEPSGADVYLDDESIGETPVANYRIMAQPGEPKDRRLKVTKPEYKPHEETIKGTDIRDGVRFHVQLVKLMPVNVTQPAESERDGDFVLDTSIVIAMLIGLSVVVITLAILVIIKLRRLPRRERIVQYLKRGDTFGKYKILGELGRGGMSVVYKAQHIALHHIVALKIPYQDMLKDEQFVSRFLREAELGSKLHHPNIIRILDHGNVDGKLYLAAEFVDGEDLGTVIKREAPLHIARAAWIVIQICEALDYAHSKQVFHKDIKPDNIMVSDDGSVKVMDFGIALARSLSPPSKDDTEWVSAYYRFPEKEVMPASDLYSLGVVFYEMLTGRVPFSEGDVRDIMRQHEKKDPVNPKVYNPLIPADVQAIIMRLLRKDPKTRFQEASEVINFLSRFRP